MLYITGGFYIRECVPSNACTNVSYGVGSAGFWMSCCSGDLCNYGNFLTPKQNIFFIIMFLLLYTII